MGNIFGSNGVSNLPPKLRTRATARHCLKLLGFGAVGAFSFTLVNSQPIFRTVGGSDDSSTSAAQQLHSSCSLESLHNTSGLHLPTGGVYQTKCIDDVGYLHCRIQEALAAFVTKEELEPRAPPTMVFNTAADIEGCAAWARHGMCISHPTEMSMYCCTASMSICTSSEFRSGSFPTLVKPPSSNSGNGDFESSSSTIAGRGGVSSDHGEGSAQIGEVISSTTGSQLSSNFDLTGTTVESVSTMLTDIFSDSKQPPFCTTLENVGLATIEALSSLLSLSVDPSSPPSRADVTPLRSLRAENMGSIDLDSSPVGRQLSIVRSSKIDPKLPSLQPAPQLLRRLQILNEEEAPTTATPPALGDETGDNPIGSVRVGTFPNVVDDDGFPAPLSGEVAGDGEAMGRAEPEVVDGATLLDLLKMFAVPDTNGIDQEEQTAASLILDAIGLHEFATSDVEQSALSFAAFGQKLSTRLQQCEGCLESLLSLTIGNLFMEPEDGVMTRIRRNRLAAQNEQALLQITAAEFARRLPVVMQNFFDELQLRMVARLQSLKADGGTDNEAGGATNDNGTNMDEGGEDAMTTSSAGSKLSGADFMMDALESLSAALKQDNLGGLPGAIGAVLEGFRENMGGSETSFDNLEKELQDLYMNGLRCADEAQVSTDFQRSEDGSEGVQFLRQLDPEGDSSVDPLQSGSEGSTTAAPGPKDVNFVPAMIEATDRWPSTGTSYPATSDAFATPYSSSPSMGLSTTASGLGPTVREDEPMLEAQPCLDRPMLFTDALSRKYGSLGCNDLITAIGCFPENFLVPLPIIVRACMATWPSRCAVEIYGLEAVESGLWLDSLRKSHGEVFDLLSVLSSSANALECLDIRRQASEDGLVGQGRIPGSEVENSVFLDTYGNSSSVAPSANISSETPKPTSAASSIYDGSFLLVAGTAVLVVLANALAFNHF